MVCTIRGVREKIVDIYCGNYLTILEMHLDSRAVGGFCHPAIQILNRRGQQLKMG